MEAPTLPLLRNDLEISPGARQAQGAPSWTLYDPVRQAFFRLGKIEFDILRFWRSAPASYVADLVSEGSSSKVNEADVLNVSEFLRRNELVQVDTGKALYERFTKQQQRIGSWLLKNYLFLRVPLVHPDRFLQRTLSRVSWLFSPITGRILMAGLLLSLLLTLRQWEQFTHSFSYLFSWQGALTLVVALFLSKCVHELGHAYTAKRYGVRVPTMGLALLVLWPVLYTDTTEAWRLTSRKQRLAIAGAGIVAELALAVVALLLWNIAPEGFFRFGLFILATATWVATLLVNANPFMRWDGYYLLADLWGVENLQPRAFALARWWLRNILFGLNHPSPESFSLRRQNGLIVYALLTWLYRLVLFLAIALLVYHFFFKLLGVFLMIVELVWFVGRPIYAEFRTWYQMRSTIGWNANSISTLAVLIVLAALLVVPWQTRISAPAIVQPANMQRLFPPYAAQLQEMLIKEGENIRAGQPLMVFDSPELQFQASQAALEAIATLEKLSRQQVNEEYQRQRTVLVQQWQEAEARSVAIRAELKKREVKAPFDGVVLMLENSLVPGVWVPENQILAVVGDAGQHKVVAYLSESDLELLAPGEIAHYVSDNPDIEKVDLKVLRVDTAAVSVLDHPMLSSTLGGPIATRLDSEQRLRPVHAIYRVTLEPPSYSRFRQLDRGVVHLQGRAQSIVGSWYRSATAVLVRESGF